MCIIEICLNCLGEFQKSLLSKILDLNTTLDKINEASCGLEFIISDIKGLDKTGTYHA